MKDSQIIPQKILDRQELLKQVNRWKFLQKSIAFTNGCFDILHQGHLTSLSQASAEADILVVALNADASVKKLKGPNRPVNDQQSRALLLAALLMVDAVVIFEEDTPLNLVNFILPDVLVKGGDYKLEEIVGAKEVIANGGRVVINPIVPGFSTSGLIDKIHRL